MEEKEQALIEGIIMIKAGKDVIEALYEAFHVYEEERFTTKIEKNGNVIKIIVKAKDAVALRAALNSYLRILQSLNEFLTGDSNG
jgi:tRNA threonylcarbamoyladenosine modification (KEOPS) complex  Pcc1 subunit